MRQRPWACIEGCDDGPGPPRLEESSAKQLCFRSRLGERTGPLRPTNIAPLKRNRGSKGITKRDTPCNSPGSIFGIWRVCTFCLATLLSGRATADDEQAAQAAVRDFNAAAGLQNVGLYDRAAEKWTAFIAQYPGDARLDRAHYYLGICQLHAKKYAEAIHTFQTLLAKYPAFSNAEGAHYNLAMARYQAALDGKRREDFQAAAEALGAVAAKYPQGKYAAAALYYRGESLSARGDARQAIEAYQKVVNDFPTSSVAADAFYALGTSQQEQGRDSEAIATFQKFLGTPALAGHEFAAEIRLRLALSLLKEKKYAEAEPHFSAVAAITAFPHADLALLRQGECRLQAGKPADAAALLLELPDASPTAPTRRRRSWLPAKATSRPANLATPQQVLETLAKAHDRQSAEAACWLARALVKAGKPDEALAAVQKALDGGPAAETVAYLELARAEALWEIPNRRKEAAGYFEKFAAAHPEHASAAQAPSWRPPPTWKARTMPRREVRGDPVGQFSPCPAAMGAGYAVDRRREPVGPLGRRPVPGGNLLPAIARSIPQMQRSGPGPLQAGRDRTAAEEVRRRPGPLPAVPGTILAKRFRPPRTVWASGSPLRQGRH